MQEQDEGTVQFVDSMGASSGSQGDCASVALGHGSSVEASDGDVLTSTVGSAEVIVDGLGAAAAVSGSVVALVDSVSCQDAGATSATPDYEESIKAMGMDAELEHQATELFRDVLQRHAQFLDERVQNSFAGSAVAPVCGDVLPGVLVIPPRATPRDGLVHQPSLFGQWVRWKRECTCGDGFFTCKCGRRSGQF